MGALFNDIGAPKMGRSVFDLSYRKKMTCDMGQLIPIMHDEMVPGDVFKIKSEVMLRFQPLVAPIMHEVNVFRHYFFVPYRLLWEDWEEFISGGTDGTVELDPPVWEPTENGIGTLWDYMGMPTGVDPQGAYPLDFVRRAYNMIYNEYYRDENLVTEITETNEFILRRAWEKDYFTSALPWQQRGVAPAIPISGTTSALWPSTAFSSDATAAEAVYFKNATVTNKAHSSNANVRTNIEGMLEQNTVDFADASTFNVSDLRLAFQIQKWMERNARSGVRYVEFLNAHFGVSPSDARLQRPEFIGGSRSPVVVSEVLQTSESNTTPQGNMGGHGISVDREFAGTYRAEEYGVLIGIMSVMPRTAYQQGINRQWLRRTRFDFYFPEFANLSEQAIERAEIYANNVEADNTTIFGYQGRYDEMRTKPDLVCGEMRDTLDYWHLGRQFSSAPLLNQNFIECNPDKRIFAVQNVPGLIVQVGNIIRASRPMPIISNPGLIDH